MKYVPKKQKGLNAGGGVTITKEWQTPYTYAQYVADMGNFPMLEILGAKHENNLLHPFSGMMVCNYIPSVGYEDGSGNDTVTRAADAFFQYLTQGFTGSVPFEAPDLLMTQLAAGCLAALLLEGSRVYNAILEFKLHNKYFSEAVIQNLGFDYTTLTSNLSDFRAKYNVYVAQFNKTVALHPDFSIASRWAYLSSSAFADVKSDYSQSYWFRMKSAFKYSGYNASTGTCLELIEIDELMDYTRYFEIVKELLGVLTDDDTRQMFGALRRVYSNFVSLPLLSESDAGSLEFKVDESVAVALHNASYGVTPKYAVDPEVTLANDKATVAVYQNRGKILSEPRCEYPEPGLAKALANDINTIIDMYQHQDTPQEKINLTSFKIGFINNGTGIFAMHSRTEILASIDLVTFDYEYDTENKRWVESVAKTALEYIVWGSNLNYAVNALRHQFDATPNYLIYDTEAQDNEVAFYWGTQIDSYFKISNVLMAKVNDYAFFSLLALPANSKSVT